MDSLRLSIDPRTIEHSLQSRKLRSVEQDGSLTYDDPESSNTALSDRLGRIWDEYPHGMLDISEAKLSCLDPGAAAVVAKDEVEGEENVPDRSEIMTYQDMQKLRSSLFEQLNTARNELWFALELAKTLGVSSGYTIDPPPLPGHPYPKRSKPNPSSTTTADSSVEPPVLPAGSYTATPAGNSSKSQQTQILDIELALAAKQQALDECGALIDSAVDELEIMSEAGDRFWRDLRQLKSGQGGQGRWAVIPRPDFTRSMLEGEKAKDVVIPYALDEAPVSLRARCLAAFDLDPTKMDPLTFGARTYRRLRVSISGEIMTSNSSITSNEESTIWEMINAAQMEAVDEELYNEVYAEISRHTNGEVTPSMAKIKMGSRDIMFEMYDTRDPVTKPLEISPACDLIASAARLSLFQSHRRRKARLVGQAGPGSVILQPILQVLQFQQTLEAVRSVLVMFAGLVESAHISGGLNTLHSATDGEGGRIIERLLAGESDSTLLSVVYSLDVVECHGIVVEVSVPAVCRITTSCASFTIQDIDDLPSIIADDVSKQLLVYTEGVLRKELAEETLSRIFLDELECVIRIEPDSVLEVSIPAPFDRITAAVTGTISSIYDDRNKPSFPEWIQELATKISISST